MQVIFLLIFRLTQKSITNPLLQEVVKRLVRKLETI